MSPTGQANKTKLHDDVVYGLLCKMQQPIRTTNDYLRKLLKHHRSLDLTYDQLREVLNRLEETKQIARRQEGNMTLITVNVDMTPFLFSHTFEHKKHNTPSYVYKISKYMKLNCLDIWISQKSLATAIFFDPYAPDKFHLESAKRKVRDAVDGMNSNKYVKKDGMPFDRLIISDPHPTNGGYMIPVKTEDVDRYLDRDLSSILRAFKKYWVKVEKANHDKQLKFVPNKRVKMIRNTISDDLINEHLQNN